MDLQSSNEGASWSSPTGNGEPMADPIVGSEQATRPSSVRRGFSGTSRPASGLCTFAVAR